MGYTRLVAIATLTVILLVSSSNPHPLTWRDGEPNVSYCKRLRTVYYAILFLPLLLEDIY